MGFLANNDDNQVYLSWMRDGARGAWLVTWRTTPESHSPALVLPGYLILGKIARLVGLGNVLVFHLARLSAGVLLLVVAYWFVMLCLPSVDGASPGGLGANAMRQSAFLLIAFSSGLGWLLVVTRLADRAIVPVDIRVPEISTFVTAYSSPHFVLGISLQLLTLICYLYAGRHPWALLGGAVSLLLLSITLVYNVIVVAAAIGSYALIRCWQRRTLCAPELRQALAVGAPSAPVVLYYLVLFRLVPFWRVVYGEQDIVRTPNPLALALGLGVCLVLALWGLAIWARERRWSLPRMLLACWVVSNGVLLYAPLSFQGKLAAGWHVGLCIVAAVGLQEGLLVWARDRWKTVQRGDSAGRMQRQLSTLRNVVLILTVPSTLLVALLGVRVALTERYFPYYLDIDDVQAVAWLARHTGSDDVVLASYAIGNYGVGHSDARWFLGHPFAVIDPQGKERALRAFYREGAADQQRRDLVASYGITFVYHGAYEQALGGFEPGGVPWLERVYRQGGTDIYRVKAGVGGGG